MLVHRLVRVYPHVCKNHFPVARSTKGACRISNRRFEEMGRRSEASTIAPGYVYVLSAGAFLSRSTFVCGFSFFLRLLLTRIAPLSFFLAHTEFPPVDAHVNLPPSASSLGQISGFGRRVAGQLYWKAAAEGGFYPSARREQSFCTRCPKTAKGR